MPKVGEATAWTVLTATDAATRPYRDAKWMKIDAVHPNPHQPRQTMDAGEMLELVESIRANNIVHPLLVRKDVTGDGYTIVDGHRRYIAAQQVGLAEVPVIITQTNEQNAEALSMILNLHREDIKPVEEAQFYARLGNSYGYSTRDIAAAVNKSQGYIAKRLGLLRHDDVTQEVAKGAITVTQARELAQVTDPQERQALTRRAAAGEVTADDVRTVIRAKRARAERNATPPPAFDVALLRQHWGLIEVDLALLEAEGLPASPEAREIISQMVWRLQSYLPG